MLNKSLRAFTHSRFLSPLSNNPKTTKGLPKEALPYQLGRLIQIGAGEAIRTPDPNLGKVMLYP